MANQEDYVFADMYSDRERLVFQTKIFMPTFLTTIKFILENYGLANRLAEAKASGKKFQIIDVGCGEGLYLHELADMFQSQELLEATTIIGTDKDKKAVSTASKWAELCQKPYLKYYLHDINYPLATFPELGINPDDPDTQIDLVYSLALMEHIPDPLLSLKYMCDTLKPGGVLLTRVLSGKNDRDSNYFSHPSLLAFSEALIDYFNTINGCRTGQKLADFMQQLDLENIELQERKIIIGGPTIEGKLMLENNIEAMKNARKILVSKEYFTEEEYSNLLHRAITELKPEDEGYTTIVYGYGQKK